MLLASCGARSPLGPGTRGTGPDASGTTDAGPPCALRVSACRRAWGPVRVNLDTDAQTPSLVSTGRTLWVVYDQSGDGMMLAVLSPDGTLQTRRTLGRLNEGAGAWHAGRGVGVVSTDRALRWLDADGNTLGSPVELRARPDVSMRCAIGTTPTGFQLLAAAGAYTGTPPPVFFTQVGLTAETPVWQSFMGDASSSLPLAVTGDGGWVQQFVLQPNGSATALLPSPAPGTPAGPLRALPVDAVPGVMLGAVRDGATATWLVSSTARALHVARVPDEGAITAWHSDWTGRASFGAVVRVGPEIAVVSTVFRDDAVLALAGVDPTGSVSTPRSLELLGGEVRAVRLADGFALAVAARGQVEASRYVCCDGG